MSDIAIAALLAATILVASMVSIEIGISVALIELAGGFVVGNAFSLDVPSWLSFIGSFAGIVLTFLAGAEVDVPQFRREWKASLSIGLVSFFAPFAVVGLLCYYGLGWNHRQAEIGGLALSTTSLAVVYAVLVETGLNRELVGKRIMSATFVTDIATVAGLTILFITPTIWMIPFVVVSVAMIVGLPTIAPWFFGRYGDRVIEPEIKLVFAILFLLAVARRPGELAGRAAGVRARPRDERPLRPAPRGAGADAGRGLRVPDALLLPEGRHERVGPRAVGESRRPRAALRREDDPEARGRVSPGPAVRRSPCDLHDAADVDRPDVRDDHVALRSERRDHRPDAVLAADRRRRPLGDRPDRDRAALVPAGYRPRTRTRRGGRTDSGLDGAGGGRRAASGSRRG